ncbi:MAG TPA: ATP-binding protein [Bacteroidales bacterium]|nr:ATP-binding protein [Bacteroidales bacterium]
MNYNLFLDDIRIPNDITWVKLPSVSWTIVRSYNEFVECIKERGLPEIVAFDHDLSNEHYAVINTILSGTEENNDIIPYQTFTVKTGYDAAKWLVQYCLDFNLPFPEYYIHTLNPVGAKNIEMEFKAGADKQNKDLTSLKAWIMIGAPGSGKTTHAKNMIKNNKGPIVRICPDDNRRALSGDSNDQSVSAHAFEMARSQMRQALDEKNSVIFDATNMYPKTRKDFISIARTRGAETIAVVFECDKQTLLDRNARRGANGGRNVGEEVIDRMLSRYQRPTEDEFDTVIFVNKL